MGQTDEFRDDLFLGCAFAPFMDQAARQHGRPDFELTRQRAYRYYEEALAKKNLSVSA
jgi:hypothetical protein